MRLSAGLLMVAGGLLPACGLNQQGVAPNADTLDFPSSALVDVTGNWLFVVNANSDLRYNDGTLIAINVSAAADVRNTGVIPSQPPPAPPPPPIKACPTVDYTNPKSSNNAQFCCWDQLDRTIMNCDERQFVVPTTTVRIGSFGAGMVYQPACDATALCDQSTCDPIALGDKGRLLIGVRGNSSLTWVNVTSDVAAVPTFDCVGGPDADSFVECDAAHAIDQTAIAGTPVAVPDEPYALALDRQRQLLYVGHLKGDSTRPEFGGVSLFDVGASGASGVRPPPDFIRPFGSIFAPDGNGFVGVTSLTISGALGNPQELFISSRFRPLVGSMLPTSGPSACSLRDTNQPDTGVLLALVQGPHTFDTTLFGSEDRGIQFIPDLNRAFVLQRNPPALVGFDLTPDPLTGVLHSTDVIETCSNPTFLQSHNPGGAGWRLYVTCFETGQIYVVDPAVPRVVETIDVGRGPSGLAFGPSPSELPYNPDTDMDVTTRGYVVGFGDNDISVVDLDPTSDTQNHVIQRIGFPNVVPR